jgi:hypothetical protein
MRWIAAVLLFSVCFVQICSAQDQQSIDDYLCSVYERTPIKTDSSGDFTWKDKSAADRKDMTVCEYAIGGMNPRFRKSLYDLGKYLDELGIDWSILSAFRDDYRQKIAEGYKASPGNSMHGGSRATGGYGDGKAVDITASDPEKLFESIDKVAGKFGIYRPMPGRDPDHIQMVGSGHYQVASHRHKHHRVKVAHKTKRTHIAHHHKHPRRHA